VDALRARLRSLVLQRRAAGARRREVQYS